MPTRDFDVRHDQVIPGRAGMLENYGSIERHHASVDAIAGATVTLSDETRVEADLLSQVAAKKNNLVGLHSCATA